MSACQVIHQSPRKGFGDASTMREVVPSRGTPLMTGYQNTWQAPRTHDHQQLQPILSDCDNIINNILEVFRQSQSISCINHSTTCLNSSSKEKFVKHRLLSSKPSLLNLYQNSVPLALAPVCRNQPDMSLFRHNSQDDSGFCSGDYAFKLDNDSTEDLEKLQKNYLQLRHCGFYYPSLDQTSSMKLLKHAKVGSFVIRDSAQPGYLYSVSVKTDLGATSVRVSYVNGLFGFDGDEEKPQFKPRFDSLIALLEYYHLMKADGGRCITMRGKSNRKPVLITFLKPLKKSPPSLAHLSRIRINSLIGSGNLYELSVSSLPHLTSSDKHFIIEYPHVL